MMICVMVKQSSMSTLMFTAYGLASNYFDSLPPKCHPNGEESVKAPAFDHKDFPALGDQVPRLLLREYG